MAKDRIVMTDEDREKKKWELYAAAFDMEASERSTFLRNAAVEPSVLDEIGRIFDNMSDDSFMQVAADLGNCSMSLAGQILTPGQTFSHFQIERLLGTGAIGEVYLARDLDLDRMVAIKAVRNGVAGAERFRAEAQLVAKLRHPNVVTVYEIGEAEGFTYLVMEYADGRTLRKVIGDKPSRLQSLEICAQIAAGLSAAHKMSIVHRDIKPENIIVDPEGRVKILDFGIAKITSERVRSQILAGLTATNADGFLGTPLYMSPEQFNDPSDIDPRSDVWSLGIILYEMIVGRRPFAGPNRYRELVNIHSAPPKPVSETGKFPADFSNRLDKLISRSVALDRDSRYDTIADFGRDIEDLARAEAALMPRFQTDEVLGLDDVLMDESIVPTATANDSFEKDLEQYADHLPEELRDSALHNIIRSVWNGLAFNPYLAVELIRKFDDPQRELDKLLIPICKIALRNDSLELTEADVVGFFEIVAHNKKRLIGVSPRDHDVLTVRFIRHILLDEKKITACVAFRQEVERLLTEPTDFWKQFFVDLAFRNVCGFLDIESELLEQIERSTDEYLSVNSDGTLARMRDSIGNPLDVAKRLPRAEFVQLALEIASTCRTSVEYRWAISSTFRVLPLYQDPNDELDHSDLITAIIDRFDPAAFGRSPYLIFTYLHELLLVFLRWKDPKKLAKYESLFRKLYNQLLPPQIAHLQIEYASCLYVARQVLHDEQFDELSAVRRVRAGGTLLSDVLLGNELITRDTRLTDQLNVSDGNETRGYWFTWLSKYTGELYRKFVRRAIENNHLKLSHFRASTRVYSSRPLFSNSVEHSLRSYLEHSVQLRPSFFARSTAAFALYSGKNARDLKKEYVSRALTADVYSIQRNAKDIGRCIYHCFYYGDPEWRTEVMRYADKFGDVTEIGRSEPKFHWAYFAGVKFGIRPVEREFVRELYQAALTTMSRKMFQLSRNSVEEYALEFSAEIESLIVDYSERGSLFAAGIFNYLNSADMWNILATTVFDNRASKDDASLAKASLFYSFAKCFARTDKEYDQKYCYNYIRCKSLYYQAVNRPPENFFVIDTLRYLSDPESKLFTYKDDCIEPWLELMSARLDQLESDTRDRIKFRIPRLYWIKTKFSARFPNLFAK